MIVCVTLFVAFWQNEKYDRRKVSEEDEVTSVCQMISISFDILKNKNMRLYLCFLYACVWTSSFSSLVGTTYLIDDLGYKQEKLSLISLINFPIGIITSIIIGKFIYERPCRQYFRNCIFVTISEMICINILFYNYETLKGLKFDISMLVLSLISGFGSRILATSRMWFANKKSNIAIASTQVTLFTSFGNMMSYIPNIYTFALVDYFGLYWPNFIGCVFNIAILILFFSSTVDYLEDAPKEEWIDTGRLKQQN